MSLRDPRAWMWAEALTLWEQADRLQRQFFQLGAAPAQRPTWEPPLDVLEAGNTLTIVVALPGVPPSHVEVVIDGLALAVRGERPMPGARSGAAIRRLEIPYGRFERRMQLPPGRYQIEQRALEDGCLTLRLRRMD
jgi:HSP20 family molecular chaperone IbpA